MININDLSDNELCVLHAALTAMVKDIHAPQDYLTEDQWNVAETILNVVDIEANGRAGYGHISSFKPEGSIGDA